LVFFAEALETYSGLTMPLFSPCLALLSGFTTTGSTLTLAVRCALSNARSLEEKYMSSFSACAMAVETAIETINEIPNNILVFIG